MYSPGEVSSAVYYGLCSVIALAVLVILWVRRRSKEGLGTAGDAGPLS